MLNVVKVGGAYIKVSGAYIDSTKNSPRGNPVGEYTYVCVYIYMCIYNGKRGSRTRLLLLQVDYKLRI